MRSFDTEPVEVRLEACYCPGTPHEADLVYLAPALSMPGGMAAKDLIWQAIEEGPSFDRIKLQEDLSRIWVQHVIRWNLVDEDGDPIEVTPANIVAALPYGKGGRLVADKADDLYAGDVMEPLKALLSSISPRGRTNGSTSRTPAPTRKRRPRSSTATTDKAPPPA